MKKLVLQALTIVVLFYSSWYTLNQVDWMTIFSVEKMTNSMEEKLGDLYWDLIKKTNPEIEDETLTLPLDSLFSKICKSNEIDKNELSLHLVRSDEVNAFALPNKHLIICTGLISNCENEAELCGVIAHEIAHAELNHVMNKLIKEVGLSVLISITSGNHGSEYIVETIGLLTSTAYDRSLEKEADIQAFNYLRNAQIDPEPFANFLYRLSDGESKISEQLSWISTHPNAKERAKYIIELLDNKPQTYQNVLAKETWEQLKGNSLSSSPL